MKNTLNQIKYTKAIETTFRNFCFYSNRYAHDTPLQKEITK